MPIFGGRMSEPSTTTDSPAAPSLTQGRVLIALAAVLWSLSGGFTKVLTKDTSLGLNHPEPAALAIAAFRLFFAGIVFVPTLRLRDLSFRPMMAFMVLVFGIMNLLFIPAMVGGTAANAILLQYTAPLWMFLVCVFCLGEKADRRSLVALVIGILGVGIILGGSLLRSGWASDELGVLALGLGSGFSYAGVVVFLRLLRGESSRWLVVLNHLGGAVVVIIAWVLLALALDVKSTLPGTLPQYVTLAVFGTVQMGLPYWLMSRGLRSVSPQEAGTITLLEPILNPVWAYLVAGEVPLPATFIGGAFILAALAWRYWPVGDKRSGETHNAK
jgi:drug/metabolite transporter (DMT)-like permease